MKNEIESLYPSNYSKIIEDLASEIIKEKINYLPEKIMCIGIEGLSNSGKTTLSFRLSEDLRSRNLDCITIEGDNYQNIREEGMKVYNSILDSLKKGGSVPENFPELIWRYDEMTRQIFGGIEKFNLSKDVKGRLNLENIISSDKKSLLKEGVTYDISKDTVLLIPGMYLRHLPYFDFMINLEISPELAVERKIERDIKRNYKRDPEITRGMVMDIEYPIILKRKEKYPIKKGAILNMTDFNNISLNFINS